MFIDPGIIIIRVYLNRQILLCINQLDQNRKRISGSRMSSENLRMILYDFCQWDLGLIDQGKTGSIRVRAAFPGFCQRRKTCLFMVFRLQLVPAPEIVLEGRLQQKRFISLPGHT